MLGKPNDCSVPGTEFIRNREDMNFCEEFSPKIFSVSLPIPKSPLGELEPKKDFQSLFKDEQ